MNIFFTDLDNTIIYSHHRKIGKSKVVVEHLDGREQSFMTEFTYGFFSSADWLCVVPVTTRTEQQYRRIECADRFYLKYAIICNGGKLLVNGKEDEEWSYHTHLLAQDKYDYLEQATEVLSHLCYNETIHSPEKYMRYVKCSDPEDIYNKLSKLVNLDKINVQRDGRKVYLFVNGITKGNAVKRFMENRNFGTILAAGDNLMDVSMLNMADIAFADQGIYDLITCRNKMKIEDKLFSDGICQCIYEMRMKGTLEEKN